MRIPRKLVLCAVGALLSSAGTAAAQQGWQVIGDNVVYLQGDVGVGVINTAARVHVIDPTSPILGTTTSPTSIAIGVQGQSSSTVGRGVYGFATSLTGASYGGLFRARSVQGSGVLALADAQTGNTAGVRAQAVSTSGVGVWGIALAGNGNTAGVRAQSNSVAGTGVIGLVPAPVGFTNGVYGESSSTDGAGLFGFAGAGSGVTYGVYGEAVSPDGFGVFAVGDLGASGNKLFQIDHPIDPANRFLNHFSAEGPEPYLVYRGNAVLGEDGTAAVELPHYFEAINRDATYQLTPIGGWANLYIAREVQNNTFVIAGGKPGMKVSWTVTGIRNDPYNRRHALQTEPLKPASMRGRYLNPELYNQPSSSSLRVRVPRVVAEDAAVDPAGNAGAGAAGR